MERLTTETPNGIVEDCHNQVFIKDRETWLRFGAKNGEPINLFDYVRLHMEDMKDYSNEEIMDMMVDDWCDELVPFIYNMAWSFAEVRERLKAYEDTGLSPEGIMKLIDMPMLQNFERHPLQEGDWTISFKFLEQVRETIMSSNQSDSTPSLEQIEDVLLALEKILIGTEEDTQEIQWLQWENGTEWGEIECPMLGGISVMTYYKKGRPCYDSYTAPFVSDGEVYYYKYDHDEDCWNEDMLYLGEYKENAKHCLG